MPFFYSDDPVRDAERHYAWLDRHYVPVCANCGKSIEGEVYENAMGGEICEDCWDKYYREDEED